MNKATPKCGWLISRKYTIHACPCAPLRQDSFQLCSPQELQCIIDLFSTQSLCLLHSSTLVHILHMDFVFNITLFLTSSLSGGAEDPIEREGDPKGTGNSKHGYCVIVSWAAHIFANIHPQHDIMSTPTPSYTPSGSKPGTPSGGPGGPQLLLKRQLQGKCAPSGSRCIAQERDLTLGDVGLVDDSNIMEWEIMIIGARLSSEPSLVNRKRSEGGIFKARLTFPENFPLYPPEMRFITKMWHPNIYPDGKVCISILHAPGEDQYGFEQAGERWMPVHSVESIVSVCLSIRLQRLWDRC
ncbi:ubiquitin-conjugating enzyme domain-containing protein [Rhizoctonia solani AG-1 IA]|uniref:Ubiquitin-conjugating enzyme domain-containing protein n=1 Tax=Thanatephorus cucumeris (strain AG1-IA) TaxID=983506 RepID=L8WL15_THACA|nr:ubiquitin-conjugating enzyme domain-containing protein [Rhizoctonia solani AG-1 IA]